MIELHRLHGFYFVAVHGGYARAARAFPYPITQPGVYRQVQRLEEELGKPLFERVGRDNVVLTSEGRSLFEFCAPFFQRMPEVLSAISDGKFGGTLRMYVAPMQMRLTVPPWLGRIKRARADVEIAIEEGHEPSLGRLLNHEVDLVVDFVRKPPEGIGVRTLGVNYGFLVLPRGWAKRPKKLRVDAFAHEPFIAYKLDTLEHRAQRAYLAGAGVHASAAVHVSSTEAILALVGVGLGYSLVGWPDERGPRQAGVTAIPLPGARPIPISVAFRDRQPMDPLVQVALDAL